MVRGPTRSLLTGLSGILVLGQARVCPCLDYYVF